MKTLVQRSLVLIIAGLLSVQLTTAQRADTSVLSAQSRTTKQMPGIYAQKAKTFRIAGAALVAPGSVLLGIGLHQAMSNFDAFAGNYAPGNNKGLGLCVAGSALILGSIPCFIISGTNAHKAYLVLKSGSVRGPGGFSYPSVGVKIKL